jgi:hypothetical protein
VDAGEHLANRSVRYELEREWAEELRPRSAGYQLSVVAALPLRAKAVASSPVDSDHTLQ